MSPIGPAKPQVSSVSPLFAQLARSNRKSSNQNYKQKPTAQSLTWTKINRKPDERVSRSQSVHSIQVAKLKQVSCCFSGANFVRVLLSFRAQMRLVSCEACLQQADMSACFARERDSWTQQLEWLTCQSISQSLLSLRAQWKARQKRKLEATSNERNNNEPTRRG